MLVELFTIFRKIHTFALNILFPIKCVFCAKEGEWLCQDCFEKIKFLDDHVCGVCEKMITPDGRTCQNCRKKSHLSGLIVAASYKNTLIARLVHLYKYRFVVDLHKELGKILAKALQKTEIPLPDIIVPVPLHPKRLRWRGFNQSLLLARHLSANLLPQFEIPLKECLVRNRYTPPQMKIKNYQSRQQNLANAFSIVAPEEVKDRIVLLVDDVATTGSTIFECAKVLKQSGAKEVFAIVIARQEMKKHDSRG